MNSRLTTHRTGGRRSSSKRRSRAVHSTGFTLIEVVLASVLATLLMTVAVGVLKSLLRTRAAAEQLATNGISEILADQIRRDVANAVDFGQLPNGFLLQGYLGSDPMTKSANLRPAMVVYQIVQGPRPLLQRIEIQKSAMLQSSIQSDAVWFGAGAVRLTTTYLDLEDLPFDLDISEEAKIPSNLNKIPPSLRIQILDVRGKSIYDEVLFHHAEGF